MKSFITIILTLFLLVSCKKQDPMDKRLKIIATTSMIADLASRVAGDKAVVTALMGPGIDPHQYKATANDLDRLLKADIILYNGLHLEAKMGEVFEKMSGNRTIRAVAESIPADRRIEVSSGLYDPHVWFDVSLWIEVLGAVYETVSSKDPSNSAYYQVNFDQYRQELEDLHEYVINKALELPADKRILVTAHDAFSYFGRAYQFNVKGLQGISTVSEAGTQDVQNLAQFIADRKIAAIFVEHSVPRKSIEALQAAVRAKGFTVSIGGSLYSDSMGDPGTPDGTYPGMVRKNIDTIVNTLK